MKKIFYLLLIMMVIQPCIVSAAITSSITINQELFKPGDRLIINLILENSFDLKQNITIQIALKNEKETYLDFLPPIYGDLNPDEEKNIELYNLIVDPNFEEGKYMISVLISSQNENIKSLIKEFTITGTFKEFDLSLNLCKDELCLEKSRIFSQSKTIYLNYDSTIQNPEITAILTYPDKTTKQLILPATIIAEQIGVYEIDITAQKEGYKNLTLIEQFAVIKKEAVIKSESNCNANSICDGNENYQSCPQDCVKTPENPVAKKLNLQTILIIAIAVVIILAVILIKIKINRNKKKIIQKDS